MLPSRRSLILASLGTALTTSGSQAQGEAWPNRPVHVVVGYPAGGGVDTVARVVMPRLATMLGQPIVIENRGGANGNIAMDMVSRASPDGYTFFFGNVGNLAVANSLYPNLGFDTARDFVPVAQVVEVPLVIAVSSRLPTRNLVEFIELARQRPGQLNGGSGGAGGPPHLALELFKYKTKTNIVHVPYRGSALALQDLVTGRIDVMVDAYNIMRPLVEAGQVKILAMTGNERLSSLAGVPTAAEAGLQDFVVYGWQGIVAPAATPVSVLKALESALNAVLGEDEMKQTLAAQGASAKFRSAPEFSTFMDAERTRWSAVVREAGITLE